jgi:hypothetical protein
MLHSGDHHLSTVRMVDALRLEQAHTESVIAKIEIGVEQPPNKLQVELDKSYANVLKNYKSSEMFSFMGQLSNIIKNFNEKLSQKHKEASVEASSEEDE